MAEATVGDIMRRNVPSLAPGDTIGDIARRLTDAGVPGLPVVDNGIVVGIVTEIDLIAREADISVPTVVPFLDALFVADGGRDFDEDLRHVFAATARELMTSPVYNIRAHASIEQIATLMIDQKVNPVPVVNEHNELVGLVCRSDVVTLIGRLELGDTEESRLTEP
jgi:CBS domain-containing protein